MKRTNALEYRFYVLDIQRPWNVTTCINIILRKMKQTILFNLQIFWRFTNKQHINIYLIISVNPCL